MALVHFALRLLPAPDATTYYYPRELPPPLTSVTVLLSPFGALINMAYCY